MMISVIWGSCANCFHLLYLQHLVCEGSALVPLICVQGHCLSTMPRQIVDATDVHPGKKGWTCIIQVIERHPVLLKELTYYPFHKRYRNYLLTDMKGTKVRAVIFDKDIDFFERSLQPFRRYKISNATVTLPLEQYQLPNYRYSWTITSKIPVEPITDTKPYVLPCTFEVCRFSDLHKFAESDESIAVKALVVHRFPEIDITPVKSAKDYVVIDDEGIPLVLRLWKDLLADYDPDITALNTEPVTVIASNLKVNTFHGLSLATKNNTYLLQNPPLPEARDLKKWFAANKSMVADLVQNKAYENNGRFFPPPRTAEAVDVSAAMNVFQNAKTCWVRGKVRLEVTQLPLYYVVCANCQKIVEADIDWDLQCSGCSVFSPMEAKLTLPVTLRDERTSIRSMIRSPDAEKLCPYTAVEVRQRQIEGLSPLNDISFEMDNTELVCFVKYYIKRGETVRRFVILKTYTLDEAKAMNDNNQPLLAETMNPQSIVAAASPRDTAPLSPASRVQPTPESQLFSPTTKAVLAELADKCARAESSGSRMPPAKRNINFGTLTAEDLASISHAETDAVIPKVVESPNKKNKGAAKHV